MHGSRVTFVQRILVFLVALATLVVLNLIWVVPTIRTTYSSASVLALATVERARADVTFSLETMQNGLVDAAEEIAFEPERKKIVVNRVLKYNPAIKSLGLAGRDGKETFLLDRFKFITSADFQDYSAAPDFSAALQGVSTFGEVFISPELEPHIRLAIPVSRAGVIDHVLIADINIRDLVSAIHTPEIKEGHIYVVDENGYQIIHPNLSEILRRPNFLSRPIVKKVVQNHVVADGLASDDQYVNEQVVQNHVVADGLASDDQYVNEQGQSTFTVGMPVSIADFSIFFETPRSVALAGVRQVIIFAGITVLLGALMLVVIIRSRGRLQFLNIQLNDLLKENYEVGKILVRRDRELTAANVRLEEFLRELDSVGKMLVRRDLELTRANTRLEELDEIKSEFVTIAAHQLRTPLTGIRWSYQILLEDATGVLTSGQRRILSGGLGASLRMINLVNDLLSVARIEEGRFGFHFTLQSPTAMIAHAVERFGKMAGEKGIAFVPELPAGSVRSFAFDEEKISLVLDNVLDNAVKYTEPGGKIAFSVTEEKNALKIVVSDTGIGVPKEQLHRVFGKFFRANNAVRFHTSGTGLGLYVSKNIVEKHNGTMNVESAESKGSTFTITLPMVAEIKE